MLRCLLFYALNFINPHSLRARTHFSHFLPIMCEDRHSRTQKLYISYGSFILTILYVWYYVRANQAPSALKAWIDNSRWNLVDADITFYGNRDTRSHENHLQSDIGTTIFKETCQGFTLRNTLIKGFRKKSLKPSSVDIERGFRSVRHAKKLAAQVWLIQP